jgi:hypothetical protein
MGRRYNLPIDNPVGNDGRFVPGTPLFEGLGVFEANPKIIETVKEAGRLIHHESYHHSYPHCWRHKSPVIFRATPQWFLSMEKAGLRRDALAGIKTVQWIPSWGEQRITSMIETRPDWCISRQRAWGVPLAIFLHKETGDPHPQTPELLEQVADLVAEGGIEAWFALNPRHLLGDEALVYEKSPDVMDVWFDSGVVHHVLAEQRPGLIPFPADIYLEGSDQHRGWFHSSLLLSVAGHSIAPYRQVLTHGFFVDEKGRKMSKSVGNVVAPQRVMQSLGADVLRLWVAATDYSGEMSVSEEILKRMSESYRRMRNTVRFLLGNLSGFDPATDTLPVAELVDLDRWALARAASLQEEVVEAYRKYEFHLIYQKVHNFCVVELGAFWLDILKDRLYTTPAKGAARRSAQTAMYHIAEAMVRWLAPILSFTAEEIWKFLPGERDASVFFSTWWKLPAVAKDSRVDWDAVIALKNDVSRELERLRAAGELGAPLEAAVDVYLDQAQHLHMAALGDELRFVLITSQARIRPAKERPRTPSPRSPWRRRAPGSRLPWRTRPSVRAAGIAGKTSAVTRSTRRSARAASATSRVRANRGATHDAAVRAREDGTHLGLALGHRRRARPVHQVVRRGSLRALRDTAVRAVPRPHAPAQRGRGLRAPRRGGRLAALVLSRARGRYRARDPVVAALAPCARALLALDRPRADPRRRGRQRLGPLRRRPRRGLPALPLGRALLPGLQRGRHRHHDRCDHAHHRRAPAQPQEQGGADVKVLLANPRGFCAGVDRAIDIVERAIELFGAPIYVRHEVVHNKFVVDRLRSLGAVFVDELDQVPDGATVIFSAHGVPEPRGAGSRAARARRVRRDLPARHESAHGGRQVRARGPRRDPGRPRGPPGSGGHDGQV